MSLLVMLLPMIMSTLKFFCVAVINAMTVLANPRDRLLSCMVTVIGVGAVIDILATVM